MERRKFSREFKIEAVKLVRERGVKVAQAARDLDVHAAVLRSWVREFAGDPRDAFPGNGQMKPEQLEIERLRREGEKTGGKKPPAEDELSKHEALSERFLSQSHAENARDPELRRAQSLVAQTELLPVSRTPS